MPNFGRYIIDADTFANATTIADPVTGATAPDGVYQYGGVYRVMTGGILSSVFTSCPSCCVDCGTTTFVIGLTKKPKPDLLSKGDLKGCVCISTDAAGHC